MSSNTDYGFMKSGSGTSASALPFSEEEIKQLLSLFISNALITSTKYASFCKRNGVTKQDINLGLKYEVREFFERNTLSDDLKDQGSKLWSILIQYGNAKHRRIHCVGFHYCTIHSNWLAS